MPADQYIAAAQRLKYETTTAIHSKDGGYASSIKHNFVFTLQA